MVKLIPQTPCMGLLPRTIGPWTLTEVVIDKATLIAPYKGQEKATSAALKSALGVGFPAVGRVAGSDPRVVWCGKGQALLIGADCPDLPAACVDHGDAWAVVHIEGAGAHDVLARLVPIDLRAATFKRGHTARTLLGHMTASVTRTGANTFEIMAMRSMAGTLVHDLSEAAKGLAARPRPRP